MIDTHLTLDYRLSQPATVTSGQPALRICAHCAAELWAIILTNIAFLYTPCLFVRLNVESRNLSILTCNYCTIPLKYLSKIHA